MKDELKDTSFRKRRERKAREKNILFKDLIGNAVKFSHRPPVVTISAVATEAYLKILVADNGVGLPAESREKIFNAFERLGVGAGYAGSGIGLAICKRIIEIHNGQISAESNPGGGSVFVIELPLTILRGPCKYNEAGRIGSRQQPDFTGRLT